MTAAQIYGNVSYRCQFIEFIRPIAQIIPIYLGY
jgi:hypothetical protein